MARMPGAQWMGHTTNSGDGDDQPLESADAIVDYRWVVEHIAAGTYLGTIAWQRNDSADVSSHFIVAKDGRLAQMVDTHDRAWTQIAANPKAISIENEGQVGDSLTEAQLDRSAQILAWCHQVHGIPIQVTSTLDRDGLAHHSMGAENGANWGHPACPGEPIKAQKPEIVRRALIINRGDDIVEQRYLNNIVATDARTWAIMNDLEFAEFQIPGEPTRRREPNLLHVALAAQQAPVIDYDKLAAALASLPASQVPTADQIADAVLDEQAARLTN